MLITREVLLWVLAIVAIIIIAAVFINGGVNTASAAANGEVIISLICNFEFYISTNI